MTDHFPDIGIHPAVEFLVEGSETVVGGGEVQEVAALALEMGTGDDGDLPAALEPQDPLRVGPVLRLAQQLVYRSWYKTS